jgi:hypothetical protein
MAEHQHEIAKRQQDNADLQRGIAVRQHVDAESLDAKADKLDALGKGLLWCPAPRKDLRDTSG